MTSCKYQTACNLLPQQLPTKGDNEGSQRPKRR